MHKPIVIAGPTGSGKSALALRLAHERNGAILNADSVQLYQGLSILTAQPTPATQQEVPHFLYGLLCPQASCSAGQWLQKVEPLLDHCAQRTLVPVVVGGTGLYLKAFEEGLAPIPPIPERIRQAVRTLIHEDPQLLYTTLQQEDPVMSQRLHPHDIHRLGRALEVIRATGLSQSEWGQMHPKTLRPVLKILVDPPLAVLEDRLKTRLEAMLQQGLVQEVALFYAHHWPCTSNLSKAVGLSPLIAHCQGDMSLEEALHRVFLETRHYVKRQRTWLKKYFQADAVVNDSFQVFSF